jgi:hypothetical protein
MESVTKFVDFFVAETETSETPVHVDFLLKVYETVCELMMHTTQSKETNMVWTLARLNYLEHRSWLYRLSGTFPPQSSTIPLHVADRVGLSHRSWAAKQWICSPVNPNTLYHLDWAFRVSL